MLLAYEWSKWESGVALDDAVAEAALPVSLSIPSLLWMYILAVVCRPLHGQAAHPTKVTDLFDFDFDWLTLDYLCTYSTHSIHVRRVH